MFKLSSKYCSWSVLGSHENVLALFDLIEANCGPEWNRQLVPRDQDGSRFEVFEFSGRSDLPSALLCFEELEEGQFVAFVNSVESYADPERQLVLFQEFCECFRIFIDQLSITIRDLVSGPDEDLIGIGAYTLLQFLAANQTTIPNQESLWDQFICASYLEASRPLPNSERVLQLIVEQGIAEEDAFELVNRWASGIRLLECFERFAELKAEGTRIGQGGSE